MMRTAPFLLALVAGLALLTIVTDAVVTSTTRDWFVRDMTLRANLAVQAVKRPLAVAAAREAAAEVADVLEDVTHDARVLGAWACGPDGSVFARTRDAPAALGCATTDRERGRLDGDVHLAYVPLDVQGGNVAGIVLVHDTSFIARREATTRRFLAAAFALLAFAASVLTFVAQRVSWRTWTRELSRFLRFGAVGEVTDERKARAFRPVVRDVRAEMERLAAERERDAAESDTDGVGRAWTAARLKSVLTHHLQGERVVVLANREPYIHERAKDGSIAVLHPASGLVTALEPVLRACSGVWVAHGSGSADRDVVDKKNRVIVPPRARRDAGALGAEAPAAGDAEDAYTLRRVWLGPEEEKGYYYGFANEGLWPLCHVAHTRPSFRSQDWKHYVAVNEKFANAACDEVESDDPIVLVQDYHLALAPRLIRERLPKATILTFWHCPWPSAERFSICPYAEEILQGLLGSSVVGFHTQAHCNNFMEAVDRKLEARIDRQQFAVVQKPRTTLVRPYPISIPWPNRWVDESPPVAECRASVIEELALPPGTRIGVGVDRIDYIKGIEERLLAVERMLEKEPSLRGRFTFVQLGAPSRGAIGAYQALNERVDAEVARINARFGFPLDAVGAEGATRDRAPPIILRRAHHEPPDVFRYLRAADLCYVSSLHDGMNLVAKEFIAARTDEQGVLVLSEFAGAADELSEAFIVNPYDLDEAADAMLTALRMSPEEQADRMRSMRAHVAEQNIYRWAGRMLNDAARLRRQERISGRITKRPRIHAA